MATNVFLVFFYGYDAQQLRHLEKWYFAFSYGIPGIPALAYVILGRTGHQIMGSATLWCWVVSAVSISVAVVINLYQKTDVDWMRIAFFYAPVWIIISATITVYTITGYRILRKRSELRSVSRNSHQRSSKRISYAMRDDAPHPFAVANNIVVTTQINCDVQDSSPGMEVDSIRSSSSTRMLTEADKTSDVNAESHIALSSIRAPTIRLEHVEAQHAPHHSGTKRNGYRATVVATNTALETLEIPTVLSSSRPAAKRTAEGHAAALAYFQVAFLMFVALFSVWLPSSINRMYQFVHKGHPSFALNIISAIVLPLQGAWNASIYIFTTRAECKRAWSIAVSRLTGKPMPSHSRHDPYRRETMTSSRETRDSDAEVPLVDLSKQGTQVHHSEVSSFNAEDDANTHRNQQSR
jgi:hypothetical protein